MSKIFCISRLIPALLSALIALGNNVNSALATVDTVENATDELAPGTDATTNTLEQIARYTQDIEETNSPSEITFVYQLSDVSAREMTENSTQATTEASNADKSESNPLNSTPKRVCREFNTNCPDKTSVTLTMEADLFVREYLDFLVPQLTVGLLNNVELEITPEAYNLVRTTDNGISTEERSSYGKLIVSMNISLSGNNGDRTTFSIQPFIKLFTERNNLRRINTIAGGVIFPLEIQVSEKWDVSMEFELNLNKNEAEPGYYLGFINSLSVGYQISNKWNTYVELSTEMTTERDSQLVATFDTGFNYQLTEKLEFDAGVIMKLTEAADRFEPYFAITVSF